MGPGRDWLTSEKNIRYMLNTSISCTTEITTRPIASTSINSIKRTMQNTGMSTNSGCADPVGSPGQKLPLFFGPKWTLRFPKEAGARLVLRSLRRNERGDRRRHPARIMHPVQVPTGAASRLQNLSSKVHVLRNVSKRPRLDRWLEMSKRRRAAPLSTSQVSKLPMRIHPAICDALKCEGTHASPVH